MSQDLIIHRFNKISNDELQVNHLNPVDEAMIADASCRLVAGESFEIFDSITMVARCQYYVAVHKTLRW